MKRKKLSKADYNRFVPKSPLYTNKVKKEVMKDAVSNMAGTTSIEQNLDEGLSLR